jgi:predicted MFS family arabinose efflux permease
MAQTRAAAPAQPRIGVVVRNRNLWLIWTAQGLAQIAYQSVNFALIVLVERTLHSSLATTAVILAAGLPAVVFASLAGVLADRYDKRRIMIGATALRALVLAGLLLVDPSWPAALLLAALCLSTFCFRSLSQTFGPAEGAVIPAVVNARDLVSANTIFNLVYFTSQLAGFAVVGPALTKLAGAGLLIEVATALYAVCTVLVWLLPRRIGNASGSAARPGLRVELLEGLAAIRRNPLLAKAVLCLSLMSSLFLVLAAVGPGYVVRTLGLQADDLGVVLAPAGLGLVVGMVLVNRRARRTNRARMIDIGMLTAGLALLGMGLLPRLELALPLATLLGASAAMVLVPSQTLLQERVDARVRARVLAALYTVSGLLCLLPVFCAGLLGDLLGAGPVLGLVGVAAGLLGLHGLRRVGQVRAAWRRAPVALALR